MLSLRSLLAATLSLFMSVAVAHHGAAAYDLSRTVLFTGRVTDFQFVNPHVLIYWEVERKDGNVVQWSGELTSPNRLARLEAVKWHIEILKRNEMIEIGGSPAKNGASAMWITRVIKANGVKLIGD